MGCGGGLETKAVAKRFQEVAGDVRTECERCVDSVWAAVEMLGIGRREGRGRTAGRFAVSGMHAGAERRELQRHEASPLSRCHRGTSVPSGADRSPGERAALMRADPRQPSVGEDPWASLPEGRPHDLEPARCRDADGVSREDESCDPYHEEQCDEDTDAGVEAAGTQAMPGEVEDTDEGEGPEQGVPGSRPRDVEMEDGKPRPCHPAPGAGDAGQEPEGAADARRIQDRACYDEDGAEAEEASRVTPQRAVPHAAVARGIVGRCIMSHGTVAPLGIARRGVLRRVLVCIDEWGVTGAVHGASVNDGRPCTRSHDSLRTAPSACLAGGIVCLQFRLGNQLIAAHGCWYDDRSFSA